MAEDLDLEESRRAGHERRDVGVRTIAKFTIALVIGGIFIHLLVTWMFAFLAGLYPPGPPASPIAGAPTPPPQPRLQANPPADMDHLNRVERTLLEEYGWVDRKAGVVRIPIERAIDLVAQRGLPFGQGTPNPQGVRRAPQSEGQR